MLLTDDRILRFTQDCLLTYGHQVRAFEIVELSPTIYRENPVPENPILVPDGKGWNAQGMHHVDAHQIDENRWIAAVDGFGDETFWAFGLNY